MSENQVQDNPGITKSPNIWIGLVFILGGIAYLLDQLNLFQVELNWWAFFILIPAAGFLLGAYNQFRASGNRFSTGAAIPALIGLFMVVLSINFLFGLEWNFNWSLFGPIVLILIGLGMVLNRSRSG